MVLFETPEQIAELANLAKKAAIARNPQITDIEIQEISDGFIYDMYLNEWAGHAVLDIIKERS